jgi:tetratricopeptide (TPR) repeat protein
MSSVETIINKVAEVGPVWLLVLLPVGLALAVLLPTVRTWLVRHKHWQRSKVAAQTALQQGRYIEAKKMFQALLKKAEEDFGPEDPKVASAARNLAMLYCLQGKYADAEPLLHRSLAIMEKADPEHIETSAILEQLAGLCEVQGRYAATELILQRSLAIRERALGPDHPHVANMLKQMAVLYEKIGKKDEAKRLEERTKAVH